MSDIVKLERRGQVLEIRLDRPKANAIDNATTAELSSAFVSFRDDPDLRVAIFTGTGRFFSAGWDLKAAAAGEGEDTYVEGGFAGITEMFDLDKPVIAAINGHAAGGGFEIALACDIIIASDNASMMLSEPRVGLVASGGGMIRLPRRIPRGIALELLYTGRAMDAAEAYRHGLLSRITTVDNLMNEAREIADQIVECAPLSVSTIKSILRETEALTVEQAYGVQGYNRAYRKMMQSEDFLEGPRAFAEKRAPNWKGR